MAPRKIIAGLGNPGTKYQGNRHNVGFQFLDYLLEESFKPTNPDQTSFKAHAGSAWKEKFGAHVLEISLEDQGLLLLKPQSFMNLSGGPIAQVAQFYKLNPADVLVVYDEVDLPLGTLRLRMGGSDGGHNGVKSIIESLGTKDFLRIRVGVGRPAQPGYDTADWVLGNFSKDEIQVISGVYGRVEQALQTLLLKGLIPAQNLFN